MEGGEALRSVGEEAEPCTLRFCNQRQGVSASVLWVDYEGDEKEYARLDELCFFNQDTFFGHPWRVRDAATGLLLAEYCGPTATISLLPDGTTRVQAGLHRPPPVEFVDPKWGPFRQRGLALGTIPISAFDCVSQEAVQAAEALLESMLAVAPQEVLAGLATEGADFAIIGKKQVTTDLPMYRHLQGVSCGNGGGDYDAATRGLGGNPGNPTTSCGEENLLMLEGDRYRCENILLHEFGHAVMDLGLHGSPLRTDIIAAYKAAPRRRKRQHLVGDSSAANVAAGGAAAPPPPPPIVAAAADTAAPAALVAGEEWAGYDPDCYMMANECEYWAEGTQAWFDATVREDVTSGVNTREEVKGKDPRLAALLAAVYGDGPWRYPQTAPRPFARESCAAAAAAAAAAEALSSKRQRGGAGWLAGEVPVLVEDNPMQPLLAGADGGGGASRHGMRRRGASPRRRERASSRGGKLSSVPRRITRALARLAGCCLGCGLP
ncbi:hypothetical protein C2E20_5933 [Micractinium conductrix]|uniref:von Hippel-Lindau disease tumour suppressor beta domain-containing protein n=1 Tax=Micractinium conductrix TaxID=554055 RepID=A0A2P6V9B8_9CHLO|nr:hypothetical protein C2E20_5933 [Micractinium conductrix]|eukprot:PSC70665.1 hypothetical protein C2E20_5933 [Micractinium conductrix]